MYLSRKLKGTRNFLKPLHNKDTNILLVYNNSPQLYLYSNIKIIYQKLIFIISEILKNPTSETNKSCILDAFMEFNI